jgi:hypothetical protein
MVTKRKKRGPVKKGVKKNRARKKSFFMILRQWSLPFFLLFLIGLSLAATFYIIFLHPPSKPLF